ncbi:MAG: cbb3-type cytochrome oxidase assembly protein CcoS [Thermaurantimonas sp.]|uniref:cbb3-type cytochrome oxidase assembly protein CcoS n=1 Tax=Thermaurantimonas sp. TaxID=2681568 RepID=UPI00391A5B0B
MEIIYLLIFISVLIASGFLIAFVWSVNSGQYDDDVTPAIRMLFDNEVKTLENADQENKKPHQ